MSAASYYNLTTYRPDSVDVAIPRKAKISTIPDWPAISVKDRLKKQAKKTKEQWKMN